VLGVLPFGTMNLLARDLGMPADPRAAVAALATAVPRRIDLAELNGRPFHTLSGLGFFSHMARAREEVRGHPLGRLVSVLLAWFRALRRTAPFGIDIVIDGKRERVTALAALVTNNRFAPDWRRPRLEEGLLEMHLGRGAGHADQAEGLGRAAHRCVAAASRASATWRRATSRSRAGVAIPMRRPMGSWCASGCRCAIVRSRGP
jgi:hypothetical protein